MILLNIIVYNQYKLSAGKKQDRESIFCIDQHIMCNIYFGGFGMDENCAEKDIDDMIFDENDGGESER